MDLTANIKETVSGGCGGWHWVMINIKDQGSRITERMAVFPVRDDLLKGPSL